MRAAFALASSKAVIQRWRSTSQLAFRWYVCAPPFEMTKLQASSTVMVAVARLIVPRHVWPISAWVLIIRNLSGNGHVTKLKIQAPSDTSLYENVPVVWEQPIAQDKPPPLISFNVICPLEHPSFVCVTSRSGSGCLGLRHHSPQKPQVWCSRIWRRQYNWNG